MTYIYLLLKLGLILSISYVFYKYISIRKNEHVRSAIGFFNTIEIGILLALTIISLFTINNRSYDVIFIAVILLTSILWLLDFKRIVLIGDKNIYINFKKIKIDNLKNLQHHGWYITIETCNDQYNIYMPLTAYSELACFIRK